MASQQMALSQRRAAAFSSQPRASVSSRRVITVQALPKEHQAPLMDRLAPSMLAAVVALSSGFTAFDAAYAPPARADDEEMTPYQKRQAELERRRELLREAREKAAARAGTPAPEATTPAPPAPAAAPLSAPSLKSNSLQSYQAATQNRPSVPAPAPEPEAPAWGGFSFSKPAAEPEKTESKSAAAPSTSSTSSDSSSNVFSSDMWNTPIKPKAAAPTPAAPVTPPPAPAVTPFRAAPEPPKPKPAPVVVESKKAVEPKKVEAKKAAAVDNKKAGKRRGPLPLWFAEVLVLGAYAGLFLAVTKYSKQSGEVLGAVWAKIVQAYAALEKLVGGKKQAA